MIEISRGSVDLAGRRGPGSYTEGFDRQEGCHRTCTDCARDDDALALAGPTDATHAIDLDGDPATTESAVEHDCRSGLRCHYAIYAQRDGCWTRLGATGDLMSEPGCERGSPKGTYCTLTGMRLMIHGDAQQYIYPFRGAYGAEEAGPRYVPGPSKRP